MFALVAPVLFALARLRCRKPCANYLIHARRKAPKAGNALYAVSPQSGAGYLNKTGRGLGAASSRYGLPKRCGEALHSNPNVFSPVSPHSSPSIQRS